jgi:hypothetical protein
MAQQNSNIHIKISEALIDFFVRQDISGMRASFNEHGFALLPNLFSGELFSALALECQGLIESYGQKRDFLMLQTANSPRKMINVKRDHIKEHGCIVPALYSSELFRKLFGSIVGEKFVDCPYLPEEFIINALFQPQDTHGWHWDDYQYGVVIAINVPDPEYGGFVQVAPNTEWDRENPSIEKALFSSYIKSFRLNAGDAYILKTDTGLHRVSPIKPGAKRIIINMVWATESETDKEISHETMEALCS